MLRSMTFISCTFYIICSWIIYHPVWTFEVRLVDGSSNYRGRVEVRFSSSSSWGTVCDDIWNTNNAKVVCRSLGLAYSNAIAIKEAGFGQGSGPIRMDDVKCNGSESSLSFCSYSTSNNCNHGEDAGVKCENGVYKPVIENSDSRMNFPRDGGLKVRLNVNDNYTVSVCDDIYSNNTIRVACYEKVGSRYSAFKLQTYKSSGIRKTRLCVQFRCTGSENRLSACSSNVFTYSYSKTPPGILCGYDRVRSVTLRGERMMGRFIIMEKGNKTTFRCETDYARPEPSISWFMDGDIVRYGIISSWSNISGSTYKKESSLSIFPSDFYHGRPLKCCSNDTFGNSVCSRAYSLFVIETSKILNNLNLAQPDQPEQPTTESLKVTSNAPLPQKSQYVTETTNIHIPVLYALAGCALLIPSVLIFVLRRKVLAEEKTTGQTQQNTEDTELENYENVLICNDQQDDQELYEVPDINT